MAFTCYFCKKSIPSPSLLVSHITSFCKSTGTNSNFHCGEPECFRQYSSAVSFKSHLIKKHLSSSLNLVLENNVIISEISKSPSPSTITEIPRELAQSESVTQSDTEMPLIHHASELISSLYASSVIPRKTVQEFIECLQLFFSKSENHLLRQFNDSLPSNHITDDVSNTIKEIVRAYCEIFNNFDTEHKRLNHFKRLGTYFEPQEVVIGHRLDTKKTSTEPALMTVRCTEQIMPLKDNLKSFFSFGNVLKDTLDYLHFIQEFSFGIENIVQASVWKEMTKFFVKDSELNLPLIVYVDDFEIGNPLGSHAGVHKLEGVYVSIPCLPPNYVSQLQNIFILALLHSSDRTRFGNNVTFQKVFDMLNDLKQNGINIETENYKGVIKFHMAVLTGDNLGLNGVLGFVESFSANRPCRICTANKEQIHSMFYENHDLLRNMQNYSNNLELNNVFETGIKEKCAWFALDGFDLFENVAVDVLHDYLEGVCPYVMKFVLTDLVQRQKLISLENLAIKIRHFNYGPDSNSKPCDPVRSERSSIILKCSASEMICLVRYFGLIVGYNVPDENEVWLLYIKLRQLLDKLLSRRIHESTIDQVKFLVAELNELYCQMSDVHLKPKFHFLTHYPQMLKKFGPLTQIWTMRFEAKHRVSKFMARASQSRVNICKTIAVKHQLILNDIFLKNKPLSPITTGKMNKVTAPEIHDVGLNFQSQELNIDNCYSTSWVMINSIKFELFSILVVDISESTCLPAFAEVMKIYIVNGKVIFYCLSLECIDFNDHFFAYEVQKTSNNMLHNYDALSVPVPATLTVMSNLKQYVTVRWTLD